MLRSAEQRAVLTAMEALSIVERAPQLVECVRATMGALLPHGVFIFGAGRVKGNGFTDYQPLGYRFPLPYLDEMRAADGTIQTPSIVRWLRTGQPQLFESDAVNLANQAPKPWLQSFNRYDLDNMAAHGVVDRKSGTATYFSFFQISARLGERQARLLRLLVPHLHLSLQRCAAAAAPVPHLSEVQHEILRYLRLGKTNWEIARIMGLSDRNAKYHVEEIIRKLSVMNRTEAAVKATALGLV